MKRKTTDLEHKLIEKGYYLSHKTYGGKKSQKTLFYYYTNKTSFIKLDSKREKVVSYGLLNYHAMELTEMELQGIKIVLDMIKAEFVDSGSFVQHELKEEKGAIIPLPIKECQTPSEFDEQEELGYMTPEQFDELCQEKEQELIDHIKGYEGE